MSAFIYPATAANYTGAYTAPVEDGGFWGDVEDFASNVGDWFGGNNTLDDEWYWWLSMGQYIDAFEGASIWGVNKVAGTHFVQGDLSGNLGDAWDQLTASKGGPVGSVDEYTDAAGGSAVAF